IVRVAVDVALSGGEANRIARRRLEELLCRVVCQEWSGFRSAAKLSGGAIPEVCVKSWRTVIAAQPEGVRSMYLAIGSSSDSLPSVTSVMIAMAVNTFVTDARSKTVSAVTGTASSTDARP